MANRKVFCVIFTVLVINKCRNIVFLTENLIADFLEII